MSADWEESPLVELCREITVGYVGSMTTEYRESGIPFFRSKNISEYELDWNDVKYISCDFHKKLKKSALKPGDVVVVRTGKPGTTCVIPADVEQANCSDVVIIRVNPKRLASHYLSYYMNSAANHQISSRLVGAVQQHFNVGAAKKIVVRAPKVAEQNKIVKILKDLDDKKKLNSQINQTLEQMAQAIFKSWFVDFEPVKAKIAARQRWLAMQPSNEPASAVCYAPELTPNLPQHDLETTMTLAAMEAISGKGETQLTDLQAEKPEQYAKLRATAELFPSAMQESELGEIPAGWESTTFGAVSICYDKHRVPLSKREREKKQGSVPYYGATSIMDYVDAHIFDDIYLLLGEDGSVLKDDGAPFTQYIWGKSWVNNHAHVLQGSNGVSTEQLYLFVGMQDITPYVTGAVQLKLNQKNMNSIPFVKAPDILNKHFYQMVVPLYAKYRSITDESSTLESLRESLLPKLLSGELSVPDAESQLSQAESAPSTACKAL